VYIDADGVLKEASTLAPDERLALLRAESFAQPGARELAADSPLRKVSLRRLEQAMAEFHARGEPLPADLRYVAGLEAVRYIFFYPEDNDVVLAGPAEGWQQLPTGEVVGTRSQRPVLHLDDFVVALRFASRANRTAPFIGCSIEPTPAGMQSYADYLNRLGGRMDRSRLKEIFGGMERAMGPQAVRLYGVPPSCRFALKMVAADYRLKRIALAHDPSPVKEVVSYLDLAAQRLRNPSGPQPQHRWWFVGEYDAVYHTPDELGFELAGQGVKVVTASTLPSALDGKSKAPEATPTAKQFATSFTKHFPALAARAPVFAELQNLIALSVVAELIASRDRSGAAAKVESSGASVPQNQDDGETGNQNGAATDAGGWRPNHFLDEKACPIQQATVPAQVASLANYRLVRDRHWLITISGGVEISPGELAGRKFRKPAPTEALSATRREHQRPASREQWWWD
jgi:hypothetical protein